MTKTQYRKLIGFLIKESVREMRVKAEKVLSSGCVDLPSQPNNYLLPKAAMHAICNSVAAGWRPLSTTGRAESKNIQLFI